MADTESSQLLSSTTEAGEAEKGEEDTEALNESQEASGADENLETYSESNSTNISHNINREAGRGSGAVSVRAEPLSAKQQVRAEYSVIQAVTAVTAIIQAVKAVSQPLEEKVFEQKKAGMRYLAITI